MSEPVRRALPPSVFARLADATRYVITGVSPDTWFGPLQPLAPMAPPEVKGRQWDYPFGANLNYIPRSDDGISFAELRGLADALPLLRSVIETRKDQIAAQSYAIRARAHVDAPNVVEQHRRGHALFRPAEPPLVVRRLAAHAARGHAGHRRGDPLSALQSRRLALLARHHRRGDDQAADRRGRARARAAGPGLPADPERPCPPPTFRPRNCSTSRAIRAPIGFMA